jgi:RHS repeat-associated protein
LNQVETISNPFKYVGALGVMDDGNGLLYMRARYYDPEVGRFISKDPIGFAGGDLNLYNYVGANPVNWVDPLGLILHYANTNSETAMKPHIKRIMTTAKGRKLLKMLHNDP